MKKENNTYSGMFICMGMLYVTCLLVSNLVAGKMWAPFGAVVVPAAVMLFPITYIMSDVFTEVYGFDRARLVIWAGFACNVLAVICYVITIDLPYPADFLDQDAYAAVLGMTPRVLGASFAGYLFGEFSNSIVMSKLKVATKGEKLWLRTIGSTVIGEALDSILFIVISFAGTMPAKQLGTMILFQYLFKLTFEVVLTPLTYRVIAYIKNKEGLDTYDYDHKYRIF